MIQCRHDQEADEVNRDNEHDDLLDGFLLRHRPATQTAPEQRRVVPGTIGGTQRGRREKRRQKNPRLPVTYRSCRDENAKTHHYCEEDQSEPGFCIQTL